MNTQGRKLWWALFAHIASIHTETRREGFVISSWIWSSRVLDMASPCQHSPTLTLTHSIFYSLLSGVWGARGTPLWFLLWPYFETSSALHKSPSFPISSLMFMTFLQDSHLNWGEMESQCSFNLHFPNGKAYWTLQILIGRLCLLTSPRKILSMWLLSPSTEDFRSLSSPDISFPLSEAPGICFHLCWVIFA